jgi:hypothetical protein
MSPAEYLELIFMGHEGSGFHAINFVATVSAYVLVAYFVGSHFTRLQASVFTIIYSVYLVLPGSGAWGTVRLTRALEQDLVLNHPDVANPVLVFTIGAESEWIVLTLLIAAWLMSIWFMFQIQRGKFKDPM